MTDKTLSHITAREYRRQLGLVFPLMLHVKGRILRRLIPKDATVIDVGAGCGQYAEYLFDHGYDHVLAIEPNSKLWFENRLSDSLNIMPFTAEQWAEFKNKRDYGFIINVLHHAENPIRLLAACGKFCSKQIIISELNYDNPVVGFFVKRIKFDQWDQHLSIKALEQIILMAGFTNYRFFYSSVLGVPKAIIWAVIDV